MSLKIIHCADVHFDSAMSGLPDTSKVNIRREEMKETFKEIINLSENADMLLIAGDLFDGKNVSKSTLAFLKESFSKIPETKVYIVAGNHDYMGTDSVYRQFDFGENVHIFGTEMECVEEAEYDIYGTSFKTANDERKMLDGFCVKNPDKINICLMHANLGGADYNPLKISEIEKSGLDYLALGHIHKASEVKRAGAAYYAYCGCPEGRGNDETGEKGVYAIELAKGNMVSAHFIPVCHRMYIDEEIDITDAVNYDEITDKINEKYQGDKNIYRFTLTGACDFVADTEVLKEKIAGFSVTVRDKTTTSIDLDALSGDFSLKGLFAKFALENRECMTEEEFNEAVKAGLSFIEKEENNENR